MHHSELYVVDPGACPRVRWRFKVQLVALVLCLFSFSKDLSGAEQWPPIPPEDLALKEHPETPGAGAMVLLKVDFFDESKQSRKIHRRIKIFNEGGRGEADVQIPFVRKSQKVEDVSARVVLPNGEIVEFRGPIYEKTLVRTRKERILAKAFALPQVEPGCIIEYRYRLKGTELLSGGIWNVQEPLFVAEARLTWKKDRDGLPGFWVPRNLPVTSVFGNKAEDLTQITLHNIPAFQEEVHMPPMVTVTGHYSFSLGREIGWSLETENLVQAWIENLAKEASDFIGKPKKVRKIVQQLVSSDDSRDQKLRKIYTSVQQRVRNLSYEEGYSKKERKREKLKERKSAEDVWKLGYGSESEITQLFVALCRAADLNADLAFVIRRDQRFYDPSFPLCFQISAPVAVVGASKPLKFFDPGTRFCPFGRLSWEKQSVRGLRFIKDEKAEELVTPLDLAGDNTVHRHLKIQVTENGDAVVDLGTAIAGQDAILRKDLLKDLSEEQRRRDLIDSIRARFPTAEVEQAALKGLETSEETIVASCRFRLPGFAMRVGARLVLKPVLFDIQSPFPHQQRTHPVYFSCPNLKSERVQIELSPGYQLEHIPDRITKETSFGSYDLQVTQEDDLVICTRKMSLKDKPYFEASQYLLLKDFFDSAQAYDQLHLLAVKQSTPKGGQK